MNIILRIDRRSESAVELLRFQQWCSQKKKERRKKKKKRGGEILIVKDIRSINFFKNIVEVCERV